MEGNQQFKEQKATEFVVRHMKGILARKECVLMRVDEAIFLGMERTPKKEGEVDEV